MPSVRVKENEPFEVALRRFKRSCEKAGVLAEVRRREFYEKPTSERKRKAAAAVKRHLKRLQPRQPPLDQRPQRPDRPSPRARSVLAGSQIQDDMKTAMKARRQAPAGGLRLIMAAIKQKRGRRAHRARRPQVLAVLEQDAQAAPGLDQPVRAGRPRRSGRAGAFEIGVIQGYLPAALGDAEIAALIEDAIAATGATSWRTWARSWPS